MIHETILIIDDEREILELLETVLKREGFTKIITADCLTAGLLAFKNHKPDVVLLDVSLPDGSGFDLFKEIHQIRQVPVLFISAKDDEVDRILGFALGAQDYITKPFSPKEVAYRVKARLKTMSPAKEDLATTLSNAKETKDFVDGQEMPDSRLLLFGMLSIDPDAGEIRKGGKKIECSAKEFKLLYYLARNPNRILTKEQICLAVWGEDFIGLDNTISVHIRKLRLKIEEDPSKPQWIQTVIGLGYKFVNRLG